MSDLPVADKKALDRIDELVSNYESHAGRVADDPAQVVQLDSSSEGYQRLGLIIIGIVFGGFGLWSIIAPLHSASFATGVVQAQGYRKPVQNLEGGIVERIEVENGQVVQRGDALLYLDDTATLADLGAVQVQLFSAWGLLDRLIAERDDLAEPVFLPSLLNHVDTHRAAKEVVANESALFNARREDRLGEIGVIQQRILQLEDELIGLKAIQSSRNSVTTSLREEVSDLRQLLEEGFVDKVRLRQLERSLDSAIADASSAASRLSGTLIAIEESKLRLAQINKRFKTDVIGMLSQAGAVVVDYEQRYEALKERLDRTIIRASANGIVLDLAVTAIGQIIRGGETLMEIVPESEELLVKAQISPADIDTVEVGDEAEIRFSAFKRVFSVNGRLTSLSADRLVDEQTGLPYYDAEVDIDEENLVEILGDRKIMPGMPADILIKGDARTLFQYLTKPVDNMFARALLEE